MIAEPGHDPEKQDLDRLPALLRILFERGLLSSFLYSFLGLPIRLQLGKPQNQLREAAIQGDHIGEAMRWPASMQTTATRSVGAALAIGVIASRSTQSASKHSVKAFLMTQNPIQP